VLIVLAVAAGVGYDIRNAPPAYLESAVVIFNLPPTQTAPNAYFVFASSLITSGDAMVKILASPQIQRQIHEAGGTANVSLALTNLYNEEYPDYGEPLATLAASSPSAADAHRTFMISAHLIGRILAARQGQAGVRPRDRISAQIVGDTGPVVQAGSPKRAFAGLALLTAVAAAMAWSLIEAMIGWRHRLRPVFRARRRPAAAR
jgi:hypothetical protein